MSQPAAPVPSTVAPVVPISTDYRNLTMPNICFYAHPIDRPPTPWPQHDIPTSTSPVVLLLESNDPPSPVAQTADGKPITRARLFTHLVAVARPNAPAGTPARTPILRAADLFHLLCPGPFVTEGGHIAPTPTLVVSMPTFQFIHALPADDPLRVTLLDAFSFVSVASEGPAFIRGPTGAPLGTTRLELFSQRRAPLPPVVA
jgi:hypothetical protein